MRVIGYDANTSERPFLEHIYGLQERDQFLPQCDYIVCCLPLMKATERLLNNEWFSMMKSNVTIVNVARKNVINDADFISFLKANKDVTAILDMFEKIPNPITNPFRRLHNVLVLPGVTAVSKEIMERLHNLLLLNLDHFKNTASLENIVIKGNV